MKAYYLLFFILLSLLAIIGLAAIFPEVAGATGADHPQFPGMKISPANIDQQSSTRWLGYLFGLGIIALLGMMLFIGNRKKEAMTSIGKPLIIGILIYFIVFSFMVFSHWSYAANNGGEFSMLMPKPTAWMIYGVWFAPLIITFLYISKFEEAIISEDEIQEFQTFLKEQQADGSI